MKHLSPQEFVDLAEGALAPERGKHVATCLECREQAEALAAVRREAREVEVPEPSPLFWDHLSRRVRDAVASDADAAPAWRHAWSAWHLPTAVTTATLMLAVVVGGWMLRGPAPLGERRGTGNDEVVPGVVAGEALPVATADASLDLTDEPEWTLLLAMVDAVEWDDTDMDGLLLDRQAIDGVVFQLSAAERREVARLLEAELRGAGRSSL